MEVMAEKVRGFPEGHTTGSQGAVFTVAPKPSSAPIPTYSDLPVRLLRYI